MTAPQAAIPSGFNSKTTAREALGDRGVKPWATDQGAADRLWTLSEQLTGVRFTI